MNSILLSIILVSRCYHTVQSYLERDHFNSSRNLRVLQIPDANLCKDIELTGNLNIAEFAKESWYIQKQRIIPSQNISSFHCMEVNLNLDPNLFYSFLYGWDLELIQYAETESGEPKEMSKCAKQKLRNPSKFSVGSCRIPFSEPFWVVEYMEGEQGFAIISGGQPNIKTYDDVCKVADGQGLWILTRERNPSEELLDQVLGIAEDRGLDTNLADFHAVNQTSCKRDLSAYKFIKHPDS